MADRTTLIAKRDPFLRKKGFVDVDKRLYDRLSTQWDRAVGQFAIAAAKEIHVETSMSRHALYDLATRTRVLSQINFARGLAKPRQRYQYDLTGLKTRKIKNFNAGIQAGARRGIARLSYGSKQRPVMRFSFTIPVYQWIIHEEEWGALRAGEEALRLAMEQNQTDLKEFLDNLLIENLVGKD